MFALTPAEYEGKARTLTSDPAFIPVRKKPASLTPAARFGTGLSIDGQNRSWILDGDATKGYTFYGDLNGDGDLTNDDARTFTIESGKPTLRVSAGAVFKVVVDWIAPPGKTGKQLALVRFATTRRTGWLVLKSRNTPLAFRITGMNGVYNSDQRTIAFDFDNDGAFDPDTERLLMSEHFVNIDGRSYAFAVDARGENVTLTPLAEQRPDRVILKAGFTAPDFEFIDLKNSRHRLSDFKGKVVLLDFWGTWCSSCVAMTPDLVRLYEAYHRRGFEIIGIEANDPREKVAAFVEQRRMPWTQTLEGDKGPIATLYRVYGWPTEFLIGPDGKFLAANYTGEFDVRAELERYWASH